MKTDNSGGNVKLKAKITIFTLILAVFQFVISSEAQAATELNQIFYSDTTWTLAGSPYLIGGAGPSYNGGWGWNAVGMANGATLTIEPGVTVKFKHNAQLLGRIVADGTPDQPIIFTSSEEGEGTPTVGDWLRIQPSDGSVFNNVQARYATACIAASHSNVEIKNSIFENCGYGLNLQNSNSAVVENNTIRNNAYGVHFFLSAGINFSENNIYGNTFFGADNADTSPPSIVYATGNWWGHVSGPHHPTLNPNGQGDEISNFIIFSPWLGTKVGEGEPDPVIIIPGILGSAQKNGTWVIDPIFHTYDDLIDTLAANGYQKGKDLFTFPYDWRQSNVTTALYLQQKINEVREICHCPKVDLVGHSMGGLVARQYVQSDNYDGDVDQLIFLGTPHLGAPKAYLPWEGGETLPSIADQYLKKLLSIEAKRAGYSTVFQFIRNRPIQSIKELLPIYDYLKEKSTSHLRTYPNGYPLNTFLEDLHGRVNFIYSNVRITNIIGEISSSTLITIEVVPSTETPLWFDGKPSSLVMGTGDGTVPAISQHPFKEYEIKVQSKHNNIPTDAEKLIVKELTDKTEIELIDRLRIPIRMLNFRMLSPADMQIIAPDGKRSGKDFITGQEFNEIEDAFYSGSETDDEYVTIPNPLDGEYKVITQGTGNGGEYTVATGYITDDILVEDEFTGQTIQGQIQELNVNVDNAEPENLDIKPADTTPPAITINSPEKKDYLRSENLPISLDFEDLESGVATSQIKFDDTIVKSGESVDLFFEKLGDHLLTASAIDMVGNTASSTAAFRIIATLDSVISDINRAYSLGWITDKKTRDSLIKKIKMAIKHENRMDKILGKSFLKELERKLDKKISDQAYELLIEDINWLLNN